MKLRNTIAILVFFTNFMFADPPLLEGGAAELKEKIRVARVKHEKLSADVLKIKEPVEVTEADMFWDGGTVMVGMNDATGKRLVACIDGRAISDIPGGVRAVWIGVRHPSKRGGRKVAVGGAEEAALHGVLLRWAKRQPNSERVARMSVKDGYEANRLLWEVHRFLRKLDGRFARVKKAADKEVEVAE